MAGEVEVIPAVGKSRIAGLVLASIVLILLGLANLPFQYVEAESKWIGAAEIELGSGHIQQSLPRMAGWPLRYWVQYQHEDVHQDRFWSTSRLIANLGMALCSSLFVYGYIQLRTRHTRGRKHSAASRNWGQSVFDVGIAMAIVLVPGIVLALEHRIANQHRRLGRQLTRYGNFRLSCWLPEPIASNIPRGLTPTFSRLRQVYLVRVDQEALHKIAEVPTLVGLSCYRGSYDTSAMEPLCRNVHFSALALERRELSESDVDLIARLRWLEMLSLRGTNLDSKLLRRLDKMQLRSVNLARTELRLSELGVPQWSATVEELRLTRPAQGMPGSLELDGWPRLKRLSVSRLTSRSNEAILNVRLSNLPNLERLALDRLQKHDCVFHDLPRLTFIDEGLGDVRQLLRYEQMVPGLMWLSNLEVDGIASLNTIGCFARDLETISIRRAPNLRSFALGSYNESSLGDIALEPMNSKRCQDWIDQLGEQDGPGSVDFTALPLHACDLSPLAKNTRIRHLRFGRSGVSFQQIQALAGMEQLESLDIRSCRLEQDQLTWLLRQFPNLENVGFDGTALTSFDLTGNDQLRFVSTTVLKDVKNIRIVDLPSLTTHIRAACTPQQLEIRNAPSLRGLVVESTWPQNATIGGLRDLEWFAGGGKAVDDALMDVVFDCEGIDQLTLAYPSVSREKLIEIGRLDRLTMLAVPGADVDDGVTANWHALKSLWEINLDDTSVSVNTLAWLSGIDPLRLVSLNRVAFSDAAADALAELVGVSDLHLEGVSIDPEKLTPLLENGNLETLNLSGWRVDSRLIQALDGAHSLRHLILRDSEIDARSLERIVTANPMLYVELGDTPDLLSEQMAAELRQRAVEVRKAFRGGWRQAARGSATMLRFPSDTYIERDRRVAPRFASTFEQAGRIDPYVFRPASNEVRAAGASAAEVRASLE